MTYCISNTSQNAVSLCVTPHRLEFVLSPVLACCKKLLLERTLVIEELHKMLNIFILKFEMVHFV